MQITEHGARLAATTSFSEAIRGLIACGGVERVWDFVGVILCCGEDGQFQAVGDMHFAFAKFIASHDEEISIAVAEAVAALGGVYAEN